MIIGDNVRSLVDIDNMKIAPGRDLRNCHQSTICIDFGDIRCTSVYHDLAHFYTYAPKYFEDVFEGYTENCWCFY